MIYTIASDIFDISTIIIFFNTVFLKRKKELPYPIFLLFFVLYEVIGFVTNYNFNVAGNKKLYIVVLLI